MKKLQRMRGDTVEARIVNAVHAAAKNGMRLGDLRVSHMTFGRLIEEMGSRVVFDAGPCIKVATGVGVIRVEPSIGVSSDMNKWIYEQCDF